MWRTRSDLMHIIFQCRIEMGSHDCLPCLKILSSIRCGNFTSTVKTLTSIHLNTSEDLNLVDSQWLSVDTIRLDDGHRMAINREQEVRVTSKGD